MALSDFIDLLPEDKREAFKADLASVIVVRDRNDADRLLNDHVHLKSAKDAVISRTTANYGEKFRAEELPKLLEEERKKGEKKPWEIEIEKLSAKLAETEKVARIEKQRSRAIAKAQEKGIPAELVDRFIADNDEDTDKGIEALAGVLKPWLDGEVTKVKSSILGNQNKPITGEAATQLTSLESKYKAAIDRGDMALAMAIKDQIANTL